MPDKLKKHKKDKKLKKSQNLKRKKEKPRLSSSSKSGSCSDSDDGDMWIESGGDIVSSTSAQAVTVSSPSLPAASRLQPDTHTTAELNQDKNWMEAMIPTYTRAELREQKKASTESNLHSSLNKPGQHPRELNPYWKHGGVGLPEGEASASELVVTSGSVAWLESAYERCRQQAHETGCSMEALAAERWGSLEKLESMIAEAKATKNAEHSGKYQDHRRRENRQGSRQFTRPRSRSPSPEQHRHRSRSPRYNRNRSRSPGYRTSRHNYEASDRRKDSGKVKSRAFRRPVDDDDEVSRRDRSGKKHGASHGWRKKPLTATDDDSSSQDVACHERSMKVKAVDSRTSPLSDDSESAPPAPDIRRQPPDTTPTPPSACIDTSDTKPVALSDAQLNALGAKILRAELMNDTDLAKKLKVQLEAAQKLKDSGVVAEPGNTSIAEQDVVLLTRTARGGMVVPLELEGGGEGRHEGRRRKGKILTHDKAGQRERYFADDDRNDLMALVEKEKLGTTGDETAMFTRLASKVKMRAGDDDTVDELMLEKAAMSVPHQSHVDNTNKLRAIYEHKKVTEVMQKCKLCFEKAEKHLIVAMGNKVYLSLPGHTSVAPGHCLIVPMQHVCSSTALDEEVFAEIQVFRKSLTQMFVGRGEDCVFMEMSRSLSRLPHMKVECVPLPQDLGDMAPIYFKKALMECEAEWAQNKKLVDLREKDVRRAIPKGFPYFSVDFGLQGGYAHVIEDERLFPEYFGREVVGGMLDVEPTLWRKPRTENFTDQSRKVLEFTDWWRPYDCTQHT